MDYHSRLGSLREQHSQLIGKVNIQSSSNGVWTRYQYPVLTAEHAPLYWRYDLNPETNPLLLERFGINGVFNAGAIKIDGVDIRDLSRKNLRSVMGMVLQDTWLFEGTIRENIMYGNEKATEEEFYAAAKAAKVDRFVTLLPDGYDTMLEEDGSNLSVGQRQLITIARAFLSSPDILILDEATSSVDTRTEMQVQQAMQNLMQGRTNFVIAHRLSTIRKADKILVMNEGKIVETGNHKELMAKDGFYAEIYNSQFLD